MKIILKLEQLGLLILFSSIYLFKLDGSWGLYWSLFFLPDAAFLMYLASSKAGAVAYNITHHQGIIVLIIMAGYLLKDDMIIKAGLIFMAHSCFDRAIGYGLKYFDSFDHTHLGWIGKSKDKNL